MISSSSIQPRLYGYDFLLDLSLSVQFCSFSVPATENETVKTLIAYMEQHYAEPISLDTLAGEVHLSRSYISEIFRKEMEQTLIQYITNLRIGHARVLLIERTELRVSEIGRLCGFENPSYFGKIFKKTVGVTPLEYRMA